MILQNIYTSRGHRCGFYSELIFVDSKALKWAHSRLRNYFSNEAIGQKQPIENRIRDRAKYSYRLLKRLIRFGIWPGFPFKRIILSSVS